MNKLTAKKFDEILDNYIKREQASIDEHNEIKAILSKVEGMPINGRTLNKKLLGEKFQFIEKYGMFHIKGEIIEHLIGYDNSHAASRENIVAVEKTSYSRGFEYFDCCCSDAAKSRIKNIQNTDRKKAFTIFSKIEKSFNELRCLFGDLEREKLEPFYFAPYYDVLRAIYDSDSKFKLSDMWFIKELR